MERIKAEPKLMQESWHKDMQIWVHEEQIEYAEGWHSEEPERGGLGEAGSGNQVLNNRAEAINTFPEPLLRSYQPEVDELHKESSAPESLKLRSGDPEVVQQEVCHQPQEAMELGNVRAMKCHKREP